MDLNRLYFEHQLTLIRTSGHDGLRATQFRQHASRTASRIGQIQRSLGAGAALGWEILAGDSLPLAAGRMLQQGQTS